MNNIEHMSKQAIVPVGDVIELFAHILFSAHNMNPGDSPKQVRLAKETYLKSQLIRLVGSKIEGDVKLYNAMDDVMAGGAHDIAIDDEPYCINMKTSVVNIKQFAREIASQLESIGSFVPTELKMIIGENIKPDIKVEPEGSNKASDTEPAFAKATEEPTAEAEITTSMANEDISVEPAVNDHRYCFIKTNKGWNLQFNDVKLNGVKDSVGMDCIKYLLQRPGYKVGVIELDTYLGTGNRESDEFNHDESMDNVAYNVDDDMHGIDYSDVGNDRTANCHNNAWVAIDPQAVRENEERLAQIDAEIKAARSGNSFNRTKVKRLEDEQYAIENYLNEVNSKPKDPQIEKARKRILKAVKDATAKIRKLEELCNYNDKLLSSHLSRNIKTGSYCSYVAEGDNLPPWKF